MGEQKKEDPTAKAMNLMVREQKAQRKKRHGEDVSSSEDEGDGKKFNCVASLKKHGLDRIKASHMMKNKDLKEHAKKAAARVADGESYIVGDEVLKFPPQWISKFNPRSLDKPS